MVMTLKSKSNSFAIIEEIKEKSIQELLTIPKTPFQKCFEYWKKKPWTYGVFFSTKICALYFKKMQFRVCFLKMLRPLKGWYVLFEIIWTFQWWKALHFMPCINDFCLFIGLPDEISKCRLASLSNLEFNFFIVLWSNLKETLNC